MANFTTKRQRVGGEAKGNIQREKLRITEGFAQIDRWDALFSAEGAAGLAGLVFANHSALSTCVSD